MNLIEKTIDDCLRERASLTPNKVFIEDEDNNYTWSYVDHLSEKMAKIMVEQGIKAEDRVAIYGTNSISWVVTFLAIQKLGAISVLINPCYKEKELADCLIMTDVRHLFYTHSKEFDVIKETCEKIKINKKTSHINVYSIEKDFNGWKNLYRRKLVVDRKLPKQPRVDDVACILFTSGTTNNCKGVMLSHKSLVNNALEVSTQMRWNEDDKMCLAVPLFHCFGVTVSLLTTILKGMSLSLVSKYKTVNVCKTIEKYKCTVLNGVPSMFLAMIKNKDFPKFDLTSLKSGIIAGSPIFEEEYLEICRKLKYVRLQPSYGLTEASPCISIAGYDDGIEIKSKTVGKIIPNVEVKIINFDGHSECDKGEVGEIYVKGYNVTKGYITVDPIVCDAVLPNGCLRTGDLGYLDIEGYLHISGRRKNLIIRGGENISPHEIEEYIKNAKNGLDVYVFGTKSEVLQEEIIACIEGVFNKNLLENINSYLKDNISRYKIPSKYVFIEEFPRNSTGKINEKELKQIAEEKLKNLSHKKV